MNFLDFFFLGAILLSVIFGILKGLVREMISLIFLFLAVFCSINYHTRLSMTLLSSIDDAEVSSFLSFLIIFFGLLVIGSLIGYFVNKVLVFGPLKSVDRILGAFFGILRGVVICCAVLVSLKIFQVNDKWIDESILAKYAEKPISWIITKLPDSVTQHIPKK